MSENMGELVVLWGDIICPPVALGLTNLPKYRRACIPPAPRFRHPCAFWLPAELNWTIESDSYNPFYFTRNILPCSVYGTHWMTSDIKDFHIFPDNFVNAYVMKIHILKLMIKGLHCRFLVPDNTQKILTEIWHNFWLKNDDEKWSRKNYFEIPWWPSELLLPSAKKSAQKGWIGLAG